MRIIFTSFVNPDLFSGGRYHAFLMAHAMAAVGHDVTLWVTAKPRFWADFQTVPGHQRITLHIEPSFSNAPQGDVDLLVIVPDMRNDSTMYRGALAHACAHKARVALLSFETPNWFNALSTEKRDENLWWYWREVAKNADMIIASSKEGEAYARTYYSDISADAQIIHCPPSINSIVADTVPEQLPGNSILCLTRFGSKDSHKGAKEIEGLIHQDFSGCELVIFHGTGEPPGEETLTDLIAKAAAAGMSLRLIAYSDDKDKFVELKQAVAMVVPSYFEGFGYPPIEALYCGTPCIAYDLSVYNETCGGALIRVPPGDVDAMRAALRDVLKERRRVNNVDLPTQFHKIASFSGFTDRVDAVLAQVRNLQFPPRNRNDVSERPAASMSTKERLTKNRLLRRGLAIIELVQYFIVTRIFISRANLLQRLAQNPKFAPIFLSALRSNRSLEIDSAERILRSVYGGDLKTRLRSLDNEHQSIDVAVTKDNRDIESADGF